MIKRTLKALSGTLLVIKRQSRYWPRDSDNPQVCYEDAVSFHRLYDSAQLKTQMQGSDNPFRRMRHYTLNHLLQSVDLNQGDVCEVGCFRGLSAYQIAYHLQRAKAISRFHIFDSFEGLSDIHSEDSTGLARKEDKKLQKQFSCPLETVKDNLAEWDFINYHKGWVPSGFGEVEDKRFSFVHIDVDLYQPIRDSFSFFYPRLTNKGIIVFDDYGYTQFPGAKKAVDECMADCNGDFVLPLVTGQAFVVKNSARNKKC